MSIIQTGYDWRRPGVTLSDRERWARFLLTTAAMILVPSSQDYMGEKKMISKFKRLKNYTFGDPS